MALNIFPRKRDSRESGTETVTEQPLPEPSPEALAPEAPRRGRGARAGAGAVSTAAPRTRSRKPAVVADEPEAAAVAPAAEAAEPAAAVAEAPARAPRSRARAPRPTPATDAPAEEAPVAESFEVPAAAGPSGEAQAQPEGEDADGEFSDGQGPAGEGSEQREGRGRRRRGGRGRGRRTDQPHDAVDGEREEGSEATAEVTDEAPAESRPDGRREPSRGRERTPRPEPVARTEGDPASIARTIDAQGRQLADLGRQVERLVRATEDVSRRGGGGGSSAPPARVGVFVDTANIELACDRLRVRFDWGKVLRLVTQDRQLVRAMAYSPIHDDLSVSIETQRFVEPFLDKGFKVVTKPFRRFQDGSIKANLDIELALDVVTMLDRLDVVVLISGDGDFQRLVELAQGRGVRVEVAAVGTSTATNLKHAADSFIDLGARARDLRS